MKEFNSIKEVALYALGQDENEWVYTNIEKWKLQPKSCKFWVIPETDIDELSEEDLYESAEGPFLPKKLESENLYPWMMQDILAGVLNNLKMNCAENYSEEMFIKGINHYRDFDAFLTPK